MELPPTFRLPQPYPCPMCKDETVYQPEIDTLQCKACNYSCRA